MAYFEFKYMTAKNTITIDDFNVAATMGPFVKRNFAFQDILNFYYQQKKDYHVMFITYNDAAGKKKKLMLYATPGEPGIQELNAYLTEKIPGKSANGLPEKEAFKMLGMSNPNKMAFAIIFVIITLILGIALFPGLTHYFDGGFQSVSVEDVASGKVSGTRNVAVQGAVLDAGMEETTTTTNHGSTSTTKTTFVPIVDTTWKEGDPIKVVLEFEEMSDAEYSAALEQNSFVGVIRNVWWEGLKSDKIDYFKEHFKLNVPSTPVLIEVTNQQHNDAYAIWVFAVIEVIFLVILLIAMLKMRK